MSQSAKKRILSGIQPSGNLHLGNYLGAIKQWVDGQNGVDGQDEQDNYICVVDLHAITVPQNPDDLRRQTRELTASLLAAGIDPERTVLFVQSHVRAHAEAGWLLQCVAPLGWLERMTQYKTKAQKQESVLTGLLTYPVLQAADILLYDPDEVPVGEDQKQHIELARDVAIRFNFQYGDTFKVPAPAIPKVGARIMGLDDPTAKMSKSSTAAGHAVRFTDSDDVIEKAFKRAVTDSGREIVWSEEPEKAGVNNLLSIYRAITGRSAEETLADFAAARGYGDLKKRVAEVVIEALRPIRERYLQLIEHPDELDRLLARGAERARALAEVKVQLMKEKMGFIVPQDLRYQG